MTKKRYSNRQQRTLRIQQLLFVVIGVMIILSMVLSLLIK